MSSSIDLNNDNYKFLFDHSFKVARCYNLILEGRKDDNLYRILSKNIVKKDDVVLISISKKSYIVAGKNVEFDRKSSHYKATTCGYVGYENNTVNVYPIINIELRWKGIIILAPQKGASSPVSIDEIQNTISSLNIKLGIDYNCLYEAIRASLEEDKGYMATFVEGKKVVNGKVSKVVLVYDFSIDVGRETADGKINFKERGFVHNVYKDLVVAHYDTDMTSIDGLDIHDSIIFATFDSNSCYKLGENIGVAEDGVSIITMLKGVISITNDVIHVKDVIELEAINLSTGNIRSNSTVIIKENIDPGFDVEIEGDLIVYGNIEDAKIKVKGNLIVSGGITGGDYGSVYVEGSIYSAFFNNASVVSKHDIVVNQIINSKVSSNNRVIVLHGKATIIGGNVLAKNELYARVVGSSSGTITTITVGRDVESNNKINQLLDELKYCKAEITKIKFMLGSEYFKNPRNFLARVSVDRKASVKEKLKNMTALTGEIEENEKQRREILLNSSNLQNSKASVIGTIYPGSIFYVAQAKKEIIHKLAGSEFYYSPESMSIRERIPSILNESEYNLSRNTKK